MTFFWGENIGRKRMIMYGAITMLVGTVRIALFHARMLVLSVNLARAGHPYERDDSCAAVRWTNCDWNCKARFDILRYVYLIMPSGQRIQLVVDSGIPSRDLWRHGSRNIGVFKLNGDYHRSCHSGYSFRISSRAYSQRASRRRTG